jgi:hypothetical protein
MGVLAWLGEADAVRDVWAVWRWRCRGFSRAGRGAGRAVAAWLGRFLRVEPNRSVRCSRWPSHRLRGVGRGR